MWDNSNEQWGMVDRNWPQIETGIKHMSNTLDVAIQLGQSPIYNRGILKTLKVSFQKWNWFAENHIQTALSKLSVKKLERIWEGWGAKQEHVEAITGCRRDLLALCLLGASTLLIHQPSLFPQSTNPIILPPWLPTKPSGASYNAAFSMHLWLGEEKKCESLFKLWLVCWDQRGNPTWNCNVECGELDTTSGRGQEVIDIVRLWGPLETHK